MVLLRARVVEGIVSAGGARRLVLATLLGCLVFALGPATARAEDPKLSAMVLQFVHDNIFAYNSETQFAQHAAPPAVPVPPMVDPPCHVCGDTSQTQGEAQVQSWVAKSQEPEVTYIKDLLSMARKVALFGNANSPDLSPAAQKALAKFGTEDQIIATAGLLAGRLLNGKAIPMARQYDKEPKQAYAGIQFLLATAKDASLLQGNSAEPSADEALQYARTWTESIANKIDTDVVSGHKYNLCPVYAEIYHQVALLGGSSDISSSFEQTIQKLQKLMTFNVNFNLQVKTQTSDGSHLNATWTGKAKLKLNLDLNNSCYTPQWDNGGQMAVDVTQWDMVGMEHEPNGSTTPVPVTLSSAHQYNVKPGPPQVNLCDPQPVFQIPLANLTVPQETVTAKGHTSNTALLDPFLGSVVGANELNSKPTNAVTGGAPSVPGAATGSSGGSDSDLNQAKAQLEAHKGDVAWLMSAQGQAAIANIQKLAMAQAQSKIASAGVVIPKTNNISQLAATMASVHLNWTNGQTEPVNQTLHVTKDGNTFTLTVTVQQAPQ